jgi:TonB family protein
MTLRIIPVEVAVAAVALALACNSKNIHEIPAKEPNKTHGALAKRAHHNNDPKVPEKERSDVGGVPVKQESEPEQAEGVGTEPTSKPVEAPETLTKLEAPTRRSFSKVEERRIDAPKAGIKKLAPVQGSLKKEVVRRGIRKGINNVRQCFEDGFERNPCLGLLAVVKFIISPKGTVRKAWIVRSETGDRAVDKCLLGAVRKFEFPPPEGGGPVTVTYPFNVSIAGDIDDDHCVRQ